MTLSDVVKVTESGAPAVMGLSIDIITPALVAGTGGGSDASELVGLDGFVVTDRGLDDGQLIICNCGNAGL